jgi:hypothetical protein
MWKRKKKRLQTLPKMMTTKLGKGHRGRAEQMMMERSEQAQKRRIGYD